MTEPRPGGPGDAPADPGPGPAGAAETATTTGHDDTGHDDTGLELARSIARGLAGRTGPARRTWSKRPRPPATPRSSSAHPDDRDPQLLDANLGRFVQERGWETELRVHGVFSRWGAVVGSEVATHARPESFADGRLVVRTDSTAWATQLRLLAGSLVQRLNEVLGEGTVSVIDVLGPHTPTWTRGRYRVKGRGPRDTYG